MYIHSFTGINQDNTIVNWIGTTQIQYYYYESSSLFACLQRKRGIPYTSP